METIWFVSVEIENDPTSISRIKTSLLFVSFLMPIPRAKASFLTIGVSAEWFINLNFRIFLKA